MKKMINVFDYAQQICKGVERGVLITSKVGDKVNPMTISWGMLGIQWGKPIFITFVRMSRFTKILLDECAEFTVNIPMDDTTKKILGFCGTKSGRDVDKVKEMDLTLEEPVSVSVPGIKEFPLTLECKLLYKQAQVLDNIPADLREKYYPVDADYHVAYYAEIVNAYIIE